MFICELPRHAQAKIRTEAYKELCKAYAVESAVGTDIEDIVENIVMNEKISNVIGYESGLINPEIVKRWAVI